jgi:protein-L-isoaspartate(D-aspartate) O-methyltransferase
MNYTLSRKRMVEEQLIPRGINDPRVLQAFRKVPRHKFAPEEYAQSAYEDYPLPIGEGQTISQPYMVALMTQSLQLSAKDSVLEIGTGSGYQAAILAELAKKVYTVERVASLAKNAEQTLNNLGYRDIRIKVYNGTMGWSEHAPYDGIVVTAGSPSIPQPLVKQLKNEARLVIPIGESFSQILTVVKKHKDKIETHEICGCVFVPLVGKYAWRGKDAK